MGRVAKGTGLPLLAILTSVLYNHYRRLDVSPYFITQL